MARPTPLSVALAGIEKHLGAVESDARGSGPEEFRARVVRCAIREGLRGEVANRDHTAPLFVLAALRELELLDR